METRVSDFHKPFHYYGHILLLLLLLLLVVSVAATHWLAFMLSFAAAARCIDTLALWCAGKKAAQIASNLAMSPPEPQVVAAGVIIGHSHNAACRSG